MSLLPDNLKKRRRQNLECVSDDQIMWMDKNLQDSHHLVDSGGPPTGPVPPMPGHESNATGLGIVTEGQVAEATSDEGSERGRLFVKVIGVKDLDLPLPKSTSSLNYYFSIC